MIDQFKLLHGDCRDVLRSMPDNSVDAIVTDPPYELGFMGKAWDATGIANNPEMWAECLRVLKPGGHLLAFSGSRTYHRMTVAIEDAGFEVRDQMMWLYGSGFPKSLDVSKAIDKAAGVEREVIASAADRRDDGTVYGVGHSGRLTSNVPITAAAAQWQGWGTALKPAHEPICVARKPLGGTVAANVLEFGTGALNIDGCRIEATDSQLAEKYASVRNAPPRKNSIYGADARPRAEGNLEPHEAGRWPANVMHDGLEQEWARFFYCAKASKADRGARNTHPTVKPTELMAYLCRLVTPPGGLVLDPFMGSGSTGKAAVREGLRFIGIDMTPEYVEIARDRIVDELVKDLI